MGIDVNRLCMGCMAEIEAAAGKCPHCGFEEALYAPGPHILPLRTIANGKYLLGRAIGEGGFGIIYLGWDLNLDMKLAVKEYYPNGFVTRNTQVSGTLTAFTGEKAGFFAKGLERFVDEAKSLAKFYHLPGIVSVRDYFRENGTAYIVMEYIEGETLRDRLEQAGGALPTDQVMRMMQPLMSSLSRVHQAKIIHRDISPDNIMIDQHGSLRLLDFGAARGFSDGDESLTILLKHGYAPMEQYQSHGVQGPWTDIYALSATIYRCITGKVPTESTERIPIDPLEKPSALGVAIGPKQEAALMKGLAVRAQDRWQTVDAFEEALAPSPVPPPPPKPSVLALWLRAIREKLGTMPRRALWAACGGCAVVAVAVIGFSMMPRGDQSTPVAGLGQGGNIASSAGPTSPAVQPPAVPPTSQWGGGSLGSGGAQRESLNQAVSWQDQNMERLVRQALEKPEGEITLQELHEITSLRIYGRDAVINESRPLEYHLDPDNRIESLADLTQLKNLRTLQINSHLIRDISPVAELPNLTELDLDRNMISDIAPVKDLTGLTVLKLGNNEIIDPTPVRGLTGLKILELNDNDLPDISSLSGLTSLEELKLNNNRIQDLSPLAGMVSLKSLNLMYNEVSDLSPLSKLASLQELNMAYNRVSDLSPLKGLSYLSTLNAGRNEISDWSPVSHVKTVDGRPEGWKAQPSPTNSSASGSSPSGEALFQQGGDANLNGDPERAFSLFLQAAELDYPQALYTVGYCYTYGEGVAQDDAKAFAYYLRAAKLGFESAYPSVGHGYAYGVGTEKNVEQAVYWYQKAANAGDSLIRYSGEDHLKDHEKGVW